MRRIWNIGKVIVAVAPLVLAPPPPSATRVDDSRLDESSGLAISRWDPQRFWTHNDSGDAARLFAIDGPGRRVSVVEVAGAAALDWEDMASAVIAGRPMIVVADAGDNARRREHVDLYFIAEPERIAGADGRATVWRHLRARYPDGPLDCEAIGIDTSEDRLIMIVKARLPWAGVYAVPLPTKVAEPDAVASDVRDPATEVQVAERIGTIPVPMATAMDIRADGSQMAVASYLDLFLYDRVSGESWEEALRRSPRHVAMPRLKQIEAVCYDHQGALWVTSEGDPMPLVQVDMPGKESE